MKRRIFALLLSLVMVVGMLPGAALAATELPVTAKFNPDPVQTVVGGTENYVATMALKFESDQNVASAHLDVDWSALGDAATTVKSIVAKDADGEPVGSVTAGANASGKANTFIWSGSAGIVGNSGPFFSLKFTLDKDKIAPGVYEIPVLITEMSGFNTAGDRTPTFYLGSDEAPVEIIAKLRVADETGNVPVPVTKYPINAVISPEGTGTTVQGLPVEAAAGETVSFSLNVDGQYVVTGVTANGEAVAYDDAAGTYSFTMPAAEVDISVGLDLKDKGHAISVGTAQNGEVTLNGVAKAEAGETVLVYVKPNEGYVTKTVKVVPVTGPIVTVTDEGRKGGPGNAYDVFSFVMPDTPVTVNATFKGANVPDVQNGYIVVYGTVTDSYGEPIVGADVKLTYFNGGNAGSVAASYTTVEGKGGAYQLAPVSANYEYMLTVSYDTKVESGKAAATGFIVNSTSRPVSRSAQAQTEGVGDAFEYDFELELYYDWEVHSDETAPHVERIYAGPDGDFLTDDDFYEAYVNDQKVNVIAGSAGDQNMRNKEFVHYLWNVDADTDMEKVFLSDGVEVAKEVNFYLADVDHDPATEDMTVKVGTDGIPATQDDHYVADVNEDTVQETVFAGEDGFIGTADDWYMTENVTTHEPTKVYAGSDEVAGNNDDYYELDADGDGEAEKVFVGSGNQVGTVYNNYVEDVNGDGAAETVFPGDDKLFNGADDYYGTEVNGQAVSVFPGSTGDEADPYDFGLRDDHYAWTVGDKAVTVRVGDDKKAGTVDDEYDWTVGVYGVEGDVGVVVVAASGVAGSEGDYYMLDADQDGEAEKVFVGADGVPGTGDDYYAEDVDADGTDETVNVGADGMFNSADDYYVTKVDDKDVSVFPGSTGDAADPYDFGTSKDHYGWTVGGKDVDVRVGDDKVAGTGDDEYDYAIGVYDIEPDVTVTVTAVSGVPGKDGDYYEFNADKTDDTPEQVFVGTDGVPGTSDDYYVKDVNGDGKDETVYAGEDGEFRSPDDKYAIEKPIATDAFAGADGKPGSPDDYYEFNADKTDDAPEKVFVGADRLPGTADDYYVKDVNGDGEQEVVFAGKDMSFPTEDDFYEAQLPGNGGGQTSKVYAGDDDVSGSEDDYYVADPDKDGSPNRVFVGPDRKPGTADDWYEHDVDGKQPVEKIVAGEDGIPGTEDDTYEIFVDENGTRVPDAVIHVGPDGTPGTEDDWYLKDADGDGEDETIRVGPDCIPGTNDDYYDEHNDEACNCEPCVCTPENDTCGCYTKVNAGDKDHSGDGTIGTPDDYYVEDVDKDGKDEVVYVGPDKADHTSDDWYYADITFDANGGTVKGEAVMLTGDIVKLPEAERSGYNFKGWTLEKDKGDTLTLEQVKAIKADTTVYASWSRRYYGGGGGGGSYTTTYTVKFETNGGTKMEDVKVERNEKLTAPKVPERTGFKFTGWFTDKETKKPYDFDAKVTKSMTLYAGWHEYASPVFNYLTEDHVAYITGYDDGNVHADDSMTRAQAAMVLYRLLNDDARAKYETKTSSFTDVPSGAWYETAVATLAKMGIIKGKPGNVFDPDAIITRAEACVMFARVGGLKATKSNIFVDVLEGHWAADGVNATFTMGWVTGYDDGKFGPNNPISRAEAVTVLNRALLRTPRTIEGFGGMKYRTWPDLSESHWAYRHIIESGTGHWFKMDNGSETWTGRTAEPAK